MNGCNIKGRDSCHRKIPEYYFQDDNDPGIDCYHLFVNYIQCLIIWLALTQIEIFKLMTQEKVD